MIYTEITITTTPEAQDLVASKIWEYSSYGVSICDDNDVLELINNRRSTWDYIEDGVCENIDTTVTLVKGYLDKSTSDKIAILIEKDLYEMKRLSNGQLNLGSLEIVKRDVDGDDWIEIWRKHYRPMDKGKVVICPEWIDYDNKDNKIVVKIDSNMAFGTGEHETTTMCIEFLSQVINGSETVLDIGTGSGILGITAIKLGAKKSVMTDIDNVAVITAKRNAKLNGVDDKCYITLDNLLDKDSTVADVIVANITADILVILANDIIRHTRQGTSIILSGILKEKVELVIETYNKLGFKIQGSKNMGEWVALMMVKLWKQ